MWERKFKGKKKKQDTALKKQGKHKVVSVARGCSGEMHLFQGEKLCNVLSDREITSPKKVPLFLISLQSQRFIRIIALY